MDTRITVIVPLYNVAKYVAQCIDSLKSQTFSEFDVICVDDGSVDDTMAQATQAVAGDKRFKFVAIEHQGQSAARNYALKFAQGEYIVFLDSDDYYLPQTLETLYTKMSTERLDLLFFSATTFYENRKLRRTNNENHNNRADCDGLMDGRKLYTLLEETDAFRPSACMFMLSKELIQRNDICFYEGIIHEDLLFTMQVVVEAKRAAFLNESLYMRRMREGSTMTVRRGIKNINGLFTVACVMERWLEEHIEELDSRFCDAYAHRLFYCWDIIAHDAISVDDKELDAYRDALTIEERIAFDLHVVEHSRQLDRIYRELYESRSYKLGSVLLAIPRWIKSRVRFPS